MDLELLANVINVVAVVVIGGLSIYIKTSSAAQKKLNEIQKTIAEVTAKAVVFISEAEEFYKDSTNAGGEKFNYVVDKLYDLVPDVAKLVVTRTMLEEIVQSTFDQLELYAQTQLDKAVNKIPVKAEGTSIDE